MACPIYPMTSEPDASHTDSPIHFEVLATDGKARASRLTFTNGDRKCLTPMFMPVGTQGSLKGLTSQQLIDLECQVVLGNTYHLANRPGTDVLKSQGGLANFMSYKSGGTLTDSGGFQMVSLLDLADINETGVNFQSPVDGQQMLLTPEKSMQIQKDIGADIIMALDDVVSSVATDEKRFEEATHRTLRWIDRCITAHVNTKNQALFGIVQGGLDPRLREICLDGLKERDASLPGYAIGGLAGGEEKMEFCKVVSQCCDALPVNKPRYVMGVGYPLDLVLCSALGADMYDCVYPSRTARFGTALVEGGTIRLRTKQFANDYRPIDKACDCLVCKQYTRASLHATITKEPQAASLLTYHNIRHQMRLCQQMHAAILDGAFASFASQYVRKQYPKKDEPEWVRAALNMGGIDL